MEIGKKKLKILKRHFYSVNSCKDEADAGTGIHPGSVNQRFVSVPELVSQAIIIFDFFFLH